LSETEHRRIAKFEARRTSRALVVAPVTVQSSILHTDDGWLQSSVAATTPLAPPYTSAAAAAAARPPTSTHGPSNPVLSNTQLFNTTEAAATAGTVDDAENTEVVDKLDEDDDEDEDEEDTAPKETSSW